MREGAPLKLVVGHPTGNQVFRQLVKGLAREGALLEVCTCINWHSGSFSRRVLPRRLLAELERRDFTASGVNVITRSLREWGRLAAGRLNWAQLTKRETGCLSIDAVYRDFDCWMAARLSRRLGANAVYAYEDAAYAVFSTATRLGMKKVYDLPIAFWSASRRLLEAETRRWPDWAPTLLGTSDSAEKLERKTRELELADLVICPSLFVAQSVPPAATREIVVAPFGIARAAAAPAPRRPRDGVLRLLFVGSMTQRKGLADLFAAMKLVDRDDVELVVLGSPLAPMPFYRHAFAHFRYERPRPNADVLALMRDCDVLCLPSIVEGRATVVLEAISQGLPVIVTANTGTTDVVVDGRSGFVIPASTPAAIAEKIEWFANHRNALADFSEATWRMAQRATWEAYIATILEAIHRAPFTTSASA